MAELKWIKVNLFLILWLQFTVCAGGSSVVRRSGDNMVLSCQHVINGQINCNGTTWVHSTTNSSVELVKLGQVNNDQSKSNRLSVAANCSLVIRKVAVDDAGYYECQQYKSGAEPSEHILVHQAGVSLSVVHMTKQKDTDVVTLNCSVETRGQCGYTVKWLHDCSEWSVKEKNCTTQHSGCSAAVWYIEDFNTQSCGFRCEVTNGETKQAFNFNHQSTEDKPGKTTCNPTRKPGDETVRDTKRPNVPPLNEGFLSGALYVAAAAVVSVVLLIVAGIIIRWRNKRNMKQVHVYSEVNLTVPVSTTTLETCREDVEPDDGVYYSTISEIPLRFNAVGDDLTSSSVAAPCPPAAAFTDPSSFYSLLTAPGQ